VERKGVRTLLRAEKVPDTFTLPFPSTATDFNRYVTACIAEGASRSVNGRMTASTAPGLGIVPPSEVLGKPVR
jgi:hypothetical protein